MIGHKLKKFSMLVLLVASLCILLCSCSFPQPKPQSGVWYCEELMIEIDFSLQNEYLNENEGVNPPYFARKYNADGTYQDIQCLFDYGSNIWLASVVESEMDIPETYLSGVFKYRNGVFSITTIEDNHTYIFERIDD